MSGSVVWFTLSARDPDALGRFYEALLSWEVEEATLTSMDTGVSGAFRLVRSGDLRGASLRRRSAGLCSWSRSTTSTPRSNAPARWKRPSHGKTSGSQGSMVKRASRVYCHALEGPWPPGQRSSRKSRFFIAAAGGGDGSSARPSSPQQVSVRFHGGQGGDDPPSSGRRRRPPGRPIRGTARKAPRESRLLGAPRSKAKARQPGQSCVRPSERNRCNDTRTIDRPGSGDRCE